MKAGLRLQSGSGHPKLSNLKFEITDFKSKIKNRKSKIPSPFAVRPAVGAGFGGSAANIGNALPA
ncbi:MAG: hypothetical protein M3407_07785, partial [Acidobacteriota bacterium]|nr:hypothetical protein [Acidobacteriota bacterium]